MSEHPVTVTYLDRQIARVSAALPAAGAFDAAPLELGCVGFRYVTLEIAYTRAGAGGDMQLKIELSPDTTGTDWYQSGLYKAANVVSGADTTSNIQREEIEYGSTAAGIERFTLAPLQLQGGAQRIRIPCQESGAVGTPGTVEIIAMFS